MTKILLLLWSFLVVHSSLKKSSDFKESQLRFKRVQDAYRDKLDQLSQEYTRAGVKFQNQKIFFRAFKEEKQLEMWGSVKKDSFVLIKTFDFCRASGCIGPKRKCGDRQVPEGFYQINRFNPTSNYYLSLGLNYPNAADLIHSKAANPGGDIFIHGSCVSIGCISITDDKIKEVYIAAVESKSEGQKNISVHIFPCRMNKLNMEKLLATYSDDPEIISFWRNLKEGYDYFESRKYPPTIAVNGAGKYLFLPR